MFLSSLLFEVLQERHVWFEDAGRPWGHIGVCSVWSEAHSLALQLHRVHHLHGEVADLKPARLQSVRAVNELNQGKQLMLVQSVQIGLIFLFAKVMEFV